MNIQFSWAQELKKLSSDSYISFQDLSPFSFSSWPQSKKVNADKKTNILN